jgi:hypothetical protein
MEHLKLLQVKLLLLLLQLCCGDVLLGLPPGPAAHIGGVLLQRVDIIR